MPLALNLSATPSSTYPPPHPTPRPLQKARLHRSRTSHLALLNLSRSARAVRPDQTDPATEISVVPARDGGLDLERQYVKIHGFVRSRHTLPWFSKTTEYTSTASCDVCILSHHLVSSLGGRGGGGAVKFKPVKFVIQAICLQPVLLY